MHPALAGMQPPAWFDANAPGMKFVLDTMAELKLLPRKVEPAVRLEGTEYTRTYEEFEALFRANASR
eukprot:COSAG04_NODE_13962_length_585_cov_1.514403_2_plen_66_part_01